MIRPSAVALTVMTSVVSLILLPATPTEAQLDRVAPAEIGLSPTQLDKITDMLREQVRAGRISGAVAAIARHGRIGYLEAVGMRDRETEQPMTADTIFRIASMTKPVTSAAVMMLVQDGKLSLDDPISKYLPEFREPRVLESVEGDGLATVPARREPTVRDLLTHTSGLTYGWFGPEKLDALYRADELNEFFVPVAESTGDRMRRIGKVPLKFQPGTAWDYGVSTDVLGHVVERISGLTLDRFFHERFFRPLKMNDTYFHLPGEKSSRLAALYTIGDDGDLRRVGGDPVTAGFLKFSDDYCLHEASRFHSGGGGLVSTAGDYLRFLQMLLDEGRLGDQRILNRETVAAMTENQIGELRIPFPGHGDGFGLGFGVLTDRGAGDDVASVGSFSWGGIFNTYFWVDPQQQMIGVLMMQLFPNDHLDLRERFKRLAYRAVDDSGFKRIYWYEKGMDHANPHFNGRQLRVNAPAASVHPTFSKRTETKSSGMARILIEEDLREIRRADLYAEVWGGHPGTANKRVSINGRSIYRLPEVGTADHHCTHQYATFNLRPTDLVNGYNSIQFACDQGDTFWGHFIVDNVALRIGLRRDDRRLTDAGLSEFDATVETKADTDNDRVVLRLRTSPEQATAISSVHYQGRYFGFDENGDTRRTDWHGMTRDREPYGMIGEATEPPFEVVWDTEMLPTQSRVAARAFVRFKNSPDVVFVTPPGQDLEIRKPDGEKVTFHAANDLPREFWSRAGRRKTCTIPLDVDPDDILAAELHVVTWTGGAGSVEDYFTLNGTRFPVAEGNDHRVVYSRLPVDPGLLERGDNEVALLSDTTHHGIEIMRPGPTLVVRSRVRTLCSPSDSSDDDFVRLTESARDESADGLECYKIETPRAVYYLDKVGAGLSSLLDRDGNDWIGFHPRRGSGAAGEYRGFPNAVFREAGSYFHPRNSATDPCATKIEDVRDDRVVISAESSNGLWAGRYMFSADACLFTLTKMPPDRKYWVLYEGTPGGEYDDTDWWMTSARPEKSSLNQKHEGDIEGRPEWIAFGDRRLDRALFLAQLEDDRYPDRFYAMEKKMTVFGFGREGMKKFLSSVPQTFVIGLVETTDHEAIGRHVEAIAGGADEDVVPNQRDRSESSQSQGKRESMERFALTGKGDAKAGRALFFEDQRAKCSTCHRIGGKGGEVGPDLSSIGGKFDRPHLIESLLEPSRQIVEGYRTEVIETKDGKVFNGVVKSRDDRSLTIVDAENRRHRIDRSRIERMVASPISVMPDGLADSLSEQEFTDLIAYMETLGSGPSRFGSGVSGPIRLPDGFEISTVATGLTGATALEVLPDGRILICEQTGALRVVKQGRLLPEPMLEVPVDSTWERGLIGVTVAPDFPTDPSVYVVYVAQDPYPHHRVSRFRAAGDVADPGSERILLRGDDQRKLGGSVPAGHQGGAVHFGADGMLYVGIGEQTANTPAQKFDTYQGKMLRIEPDGGIPSDNPFLDRTSGKYRAIWAIGCRNPFTFAVRKSTGMILINDVGGKHEEINRGVAGANYGWPVVDHVPGERPGFVAPIHVYPQASIAGGDFAPDESEWPDRYRGRYFFADFVHGWIKTLDPDSPEKAVEFASGLRRPVDLRFSADGSLYVLLRNAWVIDDKFEPRTGSLLRIRRRAD